MKEFRELLIWQRSHALTLAIYIATKKFPKEELFGLTSQLRRSCSSIPANIAEGCGRDADAELKRFLGISLGLACEVDYHLLPASELGYLSRADGNALSAEVMELRRIAGCLYSEA